MFKVKRIDHDWLGIENSITEEEVIVEGEELAVEEFMDFEFEGAPLNFFNNDDLQDFSDSISDLTYDSSTGEVSFDVIHSQSGSSYYTGFALLLTEEEINHVMKFAEEPEFVFKVKVPETDWFLFSYGYID